VTAARRAFLWALAAAIVLGSALGAEAARATSWQASTLFAIDPEAVPGKAADAAGVFYLVRGPQGETVIDVELPTASPLRGIQVPAVPGVYTLESWLEDAAGNELRRAVVTLPFDDAAPQPATPQAPDRWLLGTEPVVVEVGHPAAPLPLSGIRGYAVSVDRGGGSSPCATLCAPAETDLDGGPEDDTISLGILPEGRNYVRAVAVSGTGVPSAIETAVVKVDGTPPAVSLQGLPDGWSDGPVQLTALAQDPLSGMAPAGAGGPFTAIAVDGAAPVTAPGDTVTTWVGGSGVHSIRFFARDAAGNVADGAPGAAAPAGALLRIDEEAPRVEFAAAQDPADPERIEATVADPLSGPSPGRGAISVRLAGTRDRFEPLPTRVEGDRLIARWDSDSYPPGKYEFLAAGFDAAGNAGAGTDRARGGRMVLLNPVKAPVALAAKLSGHRLAGRLRRLDGGPVAAAAITVTETFAAGAEPRQRTTTVRTGSDGGFSLRLGGGPSRDVAALFGGTRVLTRAAGPALHLTAPAAVRLRASATTARVGGKPVVFSGRIGASGARRSVRGLPVELQFRYPGAGWSEFRTVEADARGRFRYAYRFSDDDSRGVRFRFRAYVKGREGWPYGPSASRSVAVTGR
jgi:hypothetical protein